MGGGHKKTCTSASKTKSAMKKKTRSKGKNRKKKEEFMNVLSAFSSLASADSDSDDGAVLDEKSLRKECREMIDEEKLLRKFETYYSFKLLGYDDADIPAFEGDPSFGEQTVTMEQMIESMVRTKRMIVRDPELKHEMDKKIQASKHC